MPLTEEEDRRREAERLCTELPPRPLTQRDSEVLQADPDYKMYWVRGHYRQSGEKAVTQFVVRFNDSHILGLSYSKADSHWEVTSTGAWFVDRQTIIHELNRAASSTADWHTPLAKSPTE